MKLEPTASGSFSPSCSTYDPGLQEVGRHRDSALMRKSLQIQYRIGRQHVVAPPLRWTRFAASDRASKIALSLEAQEFHPLIDNVPILHAAHASFVMRKLSRAIL